MYNVLRTVKTYDWIIATADSKSSSRTCEKTKIDRRVDEEEIFGPVCLKRVKRRCPAIILAANRTANVPGRIRFLMVSIITMNGMSKVGVPWGTKWANIFWVCLIHPKIIRVIQIGRERERVIVKWLVLVKIYGKSPKELLNTIKEKSEIKNKVAPRWLGVRRALSSLWRA